jgi:hypothetical protein
MRARALRDRQRRAAGVRAAKLDSDNKIETIQSVLRHFLGEIDGSGLGKS